MLKVSTAALGFVLLGLCTAGCSTSNNNNPTINSPTVNLINAPNSVQLGQTVNFNAQLFTPRGARTTSFLQIQVFNPAGTQTNLQTLNANQVPNCGGGFTQCTAPLSFGPATLPLGTWDVAITIFDQTGLSGGQRLRIVVNP